MTRVIDKPIIIQFFNQETEAWEDKYKLHAYINKDSNDDNYLQAGSLRTKMSKVFEVRYFEGIREIEMDLQNHRIIYQMVPYQLQDYDDYQERHKTVRLLGETY